MCFALPDQAEYILEQLENNGHEAYLVGGCVRDFMLGKPPGDIDFCTSALPGEAAACFPNRRVLKTGMKHGTVAVLVGGAQFEITTYRIDGDYLDHRHPRQVRYARTLREDLARRDFTINAMAYHPRCGLIDCFGGANDLKAGLVRCVGAPEERFDEDALRIMRALRFAAVLQFDIEPRTAGAAERKRALLGMISVERIRVELDKLLCAPGAREVLSAYPSILSEILPELKAFISSAQWNSAADSVSRTAPRTQLRLAALLSCAHIYDAQLTPEKCDLLLRRLRYDLNTIKTVRELISLTGETVAPLPAPVKNSLRIYGPVRLGQYLSVLPALGRQEEACRLAAQLKQIADSEACYSLDRLAVGGADLMAIGIPQGRKIGLVLEALLAAVIEGGLPNERSALLDAAKKM